MINLHYSFVKPSYLFFHFMDIGKSYTQIQNTNQLRDLIDTYILRNLSPET